MLEYFYKKGSKYFPGSTKSYKDFKDKFISNEFLCLLVQNPSEDDVVQLCHDYRLNEKPFKKFKTESRSLRYNINPLTFVFTDYYKDNADKVKISKLLFIVRNDLLILITSEHTEYYKELFRKVIRSSQEQKKFSTGYILYEFLHQDAKENYDVLESMDDKIESVENKVLSDIHEKTVIHEIVALKKELIKMSKRLWASSKVIFTIKRELTSIKLTKENIALLDDIYDTFLHQIDMIETQKETVTDLLEIFTTTISNRLATTSNELNMVMKKMAALTIIIMVPTLIAGIYGMNYNLMPELSWRYGYAFALTLMTLSAWITYLTFHWKKWI
ncbi:MAG: magnesium transporter CorA family protein [Candidatus Woesearchaeota archaeon]